MPSFRQSLFLQCNLRPFSSPFLTLSENTICSATAVINSLLHYRIMPLDVIPSLSYGPTNCSCNVLKGGGGLVYNMLNKTAGCSIGLVLMFYSMHCPISI